MANRNHFITGVTEILILKLLKQEDSYVYKICKDLQTYSDSILIISHNTIYAATYKLSHDGYISEYSKLVGKKRSRIYYHIEPKGIDYLRELEENYFQTIHGIQTIYSHLGEE
jgi:PadR family transcriptional regulator PadR